MATAAELAGATDDDVASARAALAAHLASLYPTLAVGAGPLADLVLGPAADALAAVEVVAAARAASYDPEAALASGDYDTDVLDVVLAGRGVTRGVAAAATGSVAVVFSADQTVTVPASYRLKTADGVYFKPTAATTVRASTATIGTGEVQMIVLPGAAGYAAVFAVTAVAVGADGNRPAGTSLTADTDLPTQTGAWTATDLAGGADEESDAALLARLPAATEPRGAGTAAGIEGIINTEAPAVNDVVVMGYGHAGMTRARSALGLKAPGKADARVRVVGLGRTAVRVTATYIGLDGSYGRWRFSFTAADAVDWVYVEKVVQANANPGGAGYTPTVTISYDTDDDPLAPEIRSTLDGAFSVYAGATVAFTDPVTATGALTINVSTKTYDAVVRTAAGMTDAQTALNDPDDRPAGGDCLVKAACPVTCTVIAVATPQSGVTLTAAEVREAVAAAVNALAISPTLSGAAVSAAASALLPAGTAVALTNWVGTVRAADGTTSTVTGDSGLSVATDWTKGLGPDAVAFYCDSTGVTAIVS